MCAPLPLCPCLSTDSQHPAGLLALLHEDDPALLSYALSSLLSPSVVNVFWPEISERITGIEEIYENAALESGVRDKAALLASKVYYHLGSTEDALQFALSAGELFTVDRDEVDEQDREYTETVTAACIDAYIRERAALAGDGEAGAALAATGSGATASAGKGKGERATAIMGVKKLTAAISLSLFLFLYLSASTSTSASASTSTFISASFREPDSNSLLVNLASTQDAKDCRADDQQVHQGRRVQAGHGGGPGCTAVGYH